MIKINILILGIQEINQSITTIWREFIQEKLLNHSKKQTNKQKNHTKKTKTQYNLGHFLTWPIHMSLSPVLW